MPGKKFIFSRKYELVVKNREIVKSVTIVVPVDSIGDDDMGSGTKDMQASAVAKAASFRADHALPLHHGQRTTSLTRSRRGRPRRGKPVRVDIIKERRAGSSRAATTSPHDRRGGPGPLYTRDRTDLAPYGLDEQLDEPARAQRRRQADGAGSHGRAQACSGCGERVHDQDVARQQHVVGAVGPTRRTQRDIPDAVADVGGLLVRA